MAWPLTPLTTYVASSTPSIKAFDLNSIQEAINKILLGTYSHRCMTIDGTGGFAAPFVNGLKITVPNPAANQPFTNILLGANMVKAWARIQTGASFTMSEGFNIAALSFGAPNAIRITLASPMIGPINYGVNLTSASGGGTTMLAYTGVSASAFDIFANVSTSGAIVNLQAVAIFVAVTVVGKQ